MQVDKWDGTKKRVEFDSVRQMFDAAEEAAEDPNTKKITLHFPKPKIPGGRKRGGKR